MQGTKWILVVIIVAVGLVAAEGWVAAQAGKTDLSVQVLSSAFGTTTFKEGATFEKDYPQLIVKNVGSAPSSGRWLATYNCKPVAGSGPGGATPVCPTDAELKFGTAAATSPVLTPGQQWTLWVKPNYNKMKAGKYVLSGTLVYDGDTNTNNNYQELTITVTPPPPPIPINAPLSAPTGVTAAAKSAAESAVVILTYVEHAMLRPPAGVIVERKGMLGGFEPIAKTTHSGPVKVDKGDGVKQTYQDGPLKAGTYTYRLKAYDSKGESGYSNETSITIKGGITPPQGKLVE